MARDLRLEVILQAVDRATRPIRAVTQGGSELASTLKASREALKGLQNQQKDVESFRAVQAASKQTSEAIRANRERIKALSEQMAVAARPTRQMTTEFQRAMREGHKLKASYSEQQRQLQTLQTRLNSAGIQTNRLGAEELRLRRRIEQSTRSITQQQDSMRRLAQQQERLAKARDAYAQAKERAGGIASMGAVGIAEGYALSRPLAAVMGAYAPAEDAAAQLRASMMGADGSVAEDFAKISALATSLGDRLPGTTAQFQEMMTMLRRQGISAQSILGGTGEAAAYLAVQLKMGSTDAAEFAAKMQDATRTTEGDMMGLMDMIQRTFYLGVDSTNMLYGFSKLSPALGILRKSGLEAANTLAPLLVMMDQVGMSGEPAGNALRKVFQAGLNLDKVSKANKEIKKLGISLDFTDGKGEFGGLEKLFAQLDKLKKLNSVQRTSVLSTVFGDDAETLQVVQTMIDKGIAGYQEVAGKMQAQADLRKRVDDQLKTLTNVIDAAQGSWTNAMAEFGAAVAPELKGLIQWLGSIASGIGAWARENPQLAGTLVKVTAGISALAFAGGALAIGMAGLIGPFAMAKLAISTFGITTGIALGPVLLIIAAVAALAGGAYLIWKHWGTLGPKFAALWEGVKAQFASLMTWFAGLPERFRQFGADILQGLANGITGALGSVKTAITGAGGAVIGWFKEKLGIHSPSRVFAQLGGFTMQGLEQGLLKGQDGPLAAVAGLGRQLTQAGALTVGVGAAGSALAIDSRPPLAAGGAAPIVVQGDTIQIIIQAGAGSNTGDLAQQINRILDDRERAKAARVRSRLHDQE
ncbi:phage tail tape measure protein [Azotobacter chroococcum]|uniref:TP901 family phage tail tape measure protein n=1 Tax=Azotobacter chroococcum TaxID=353 RepID=A0A4R1PRR7_9GAMM|nr:phage tail tape measure protein [Azotobacter chroococcum]TBV91305.1 phage tail tape measure protein [Azotobacter chroococcum]TCL32541.1 TP901 family phage tail tape measure protein [Azotobacter chroococcum]